MKEFNTIIIGGGASGLMCAVELLSGNEAFLGNRVLILEANDRVAKKLSATGNGQGNLTNKSIKAENFYGDKQFIEAFLSTEKSLDLKNYFYKMGIPLTEGAEGKMYPLSKQANAVTDIIRAYLSDRGCAVYTGKRVDGISLKNGEYTVLCGGEAFTAKNVVLAVGGCTAKQFGTDGSAYRLAEKLGHKKTTLYPSLVQLKTETEKIRGLKGIKETARIIAYDGKTQVKQAVGDILFTEFGISGNAVFKVSAALVAAQNPSVKIEFLPELTIGEITSILQDRQHKPGMDGADCYLGLINKRVGQALYKTVATKSGTNNASSTSNNANTHNTPKFANTPTVQQLAAAVKGLTLKVTGTLGFNHAQVTKGGIITDDVNPLTYESKLAKNLYLVGEVLNVDGDCGGYNLTFAFTSGITAAKAIKANAKEIKE